MTHIHGEVTITKRNADTMDVVEVITQPNYITEWGEQRRRHMFVAGVNSSYVLSSTHDSSLKNSDSIWISPSKMTKDFTTVAFTPSEDAVKGDNFTVTRVEAATPYVEFTVRYGQPTSQRTINMIGIRDTETTWYNVYWSIAALDSTCYQETNEILDVTYRWNVVYASTPTTPTDSKSRTMFCGTPEKLGRHLMGLEYGVYPKIEYASLARLPKQEHTKHYNSVQVDFKHRYGLATGSYDQRARVSYTTSLGTGSVVGNVLRSTMHNGLDETVGFMYEFAGEDFLNQPIQPIHNHSSEAPHPFLNVDYLATSVGDLAADGSAWVADDNKFPELFRVEYISGGDISTAKYNFRKRATVGFGGASYRGEIRDTVFDTSFDNVVGGHVHADLFNNNVEYNLSAAVYYDDTGISVIDRMDGAIVTLDATTTPPLPTTSITRVVVDDNLNVWVACGLTGVYKIEDIYGTPIVTNYTTASGLVSDVCYGIAIGYGDRVWVLVSGGLYSSDDYGATWDIHDSNSPHPFEYVGITDGNWDAVKYLLADRDHSDHPIALVTSASSSLTNIQPIWYSAVIPATAGASYAVGIHRSLTASSSNRISGFNRMISVSRYGSMWGCASGGVAYVTPKLLTHGSTASISMPSSSYWQPGAVDQPTFLYDYYRTPHMVSFTRSNVGLTQPHLFTPQGWVVDSVYVVESESRETYGISDIPETGGGNCVGMLMEPPAPVSHTSVHSRGILSIEPTSPYNISLGGQFSIFEERMWEKYHWNGSAWVQNYYSPALDTSGNGNDAIRHNFNTESNFFTGRSLIDASSTFSANTFVDELTFVTTITPSAKFTSGIGVTPLNRQQQTGMQRLISIAELDGQYLTLSIADVNDPQQIAVDHGTVANHTHTTLGSALALDSVTQYRVAIAITATTVDVFIDGVQFGTTITLAAPYDFTNVGANLVAYIGSDTYENDVVASTSTSPRHFYRGAMSNAQLWNVAFDAADASADMIDVGGVASTPPAAALITRLELNQSMVGLETKTTHSALEPLINGVSMSFNDVVSSGAAFAAVATDYYTFGVVDGVLKDNAISLTRQNYTYMTDQDVEFGEFLAVDGSNIIPAALSTPVVDEQPIFYRNAASAFIRPGQLAPNWHTVTGWTAGALSSCALPTDGYVECGISEPSFRGCFIGLTTNTTAVAHYSHHECMLLVTGGLLRVYEGGSLIVDIGNVVVGDTIRVERTGTTVTYSTVSGGIPTILHTSAIALSGTIAAVAVVSGRGCGVKDLKLKYQQLPHVIEIGNPSNLTGRYDPDFNYIDDINPNTNSKLYLDGVEALIVGIDNYANDEASIVPNQGELLVSKYGGFIVANPLDAGKAVTGWVNIIKR